MTNRAASAALSLRTKQALVRILFGAQGNGKYDKVLQRDGTSDKLAAKYSFADLKKAYLERVQELHPDKRRVIFEENLSSKDGNPIDTIKINPEKHLCKNLTCTKEFIDLQSAWEKYEALVKGMNAEGASGRMEDEANFTLFGVGCSFADNDMERDFRDEIMNQAAKGWIPSGTIAMLADDDAKMNVGKQNGGTIPLTSDDWFEEFSNYDPSTSNIQSSDNNAGKLDGINYRRSLVSHKVPNLCK